VIGVGLGFLNSLVAEFATKNNKERHAVTFSTAAGCWLSGMMSPLTEQSTPASPLASAVACAAVSILVAAAFRGPLARVVVASFGSLVVAALAGWTWCEAELLADRLRSFEREGLRPRVEIELSRALGRPIRLRVAAAYPVDSHSVFAIRGPAMMVIAAAPGFEYRAFV